LTSFCEPISEDSFGRGCIDSACALLPVQEPAAPMSSLAFYSLRPFGDFQYNQHSNEKFISNRHQIDILCLSKLYFIFIPYLLYLSEPLFDKNTFISLMKLNCITIKRKSFHTQYRHISINLSVKT